MKKNNWYLLLILFLSQVAFGQKLSQRAYQVFDTNVVVAADIGYSAAPIALMFPFRNDIDKLKYRNNVRAVLGLGFSYKWLSLRIGLTLPGHLRSTERYGNSNYFDLGANFTVRKVFFDIDLHVYKGYAIKNGFRWNDTLDKQHPHEFRPDVQATGFSFNTWYFKSNDVKMQAIRGKTAHYVKNVSSWYIKMGANLHDLGAENRIVPDSLIQIKSSKTLSQKLGAVDITGIPGFIIIRRVKQFQFCAMAGFGFAVQAKYYQYLDNSRAFLGLAPRYDVMLSIGYNTKKAFLMLVTDIDNKSIRFTDFKYRQSFYTLKLIGGYRLSGKRLRKNIPWL